jgi:hypothetical protein
VYLGNDYFVEKGLEFLGYKKKERKPRGDGQPREKKHTFL